MNDVVGTVVRFSAGSTSVELTINEDNPAVRDFMSMLPLTLTLEEFGGREKIAYLPRKLSMDGVPAGDDPFPRDIGYYHPSGDLVFYYDDVGYFPGIVWIGQFDGSMEAIVRQTSIFTARIERAM